MAAGTRWALASLLLLAVPARAGEEGPRIAAGLRSDDPARRRSALEALILGARGLPEEEAERLRGPVERLLAGERDPDARALQIRALGRLGGAAAAAPLLRVLAVEEEPAPQAALVEAFADLPAEAVARPLSALAFRSPEPRVGALAAEAMARVPGEECLRGLLALADTTHAWPVQAAVVRSLGLRDSPEVVARVLAALRAEDPSVRTAAREAGEMLLGEDLGPDPADWDARWAKAREGWRKGAPAPVAGGESVSVAGPPPERRSTARFFDIPVAGSRVAFIVDCSQSMWGTKMETAQREVTEAVKGLRAGQRFGVVLFHDKVWTWREGLVAATPAQKWAFARTVPDLPTKSYTNLGDALERAFGWAGEGRWPLPDPPGLDEVFLLTDGEPNRGRVKDVDGIAEAVRGWNGRARVRLHAVALGERAGVELLKRLASENGGTFVRR